MGIIEEGAGVSGSEERKQFVEGKYQEFLEENGEALDDHYDEEPAIVFECNLLQDGDGGILLEDLNFNTSLKGLGKCSIILYDNEDDKEPPHFHIKGRTDTSIDGRKGYFDGCVYLFKDSFFPHGSHPDTFANVTGVNHKNLAKALNKFMYSKDKRDKTRTRWQMFRDRYCEMHGPGVDNSYLKATQPNYNNAI